MTLCCVWHSDDGWQLASDSRLTVAGDLVVDISIKVASFRVRIPFPSSKGMEGERMLLDQEVGFMAAGDVATTLPTRESFRAAMSWLWINPSFGPELSMQQIANICGEILLRLWRRRSEMDVEPVLATVCLVGWCPSQKTARAFLLAPRVERDTTSVLVHEVDALAGPRYFGSGREAAQRLAADRPDLTPPQVIREVVRQQLDDAVGGRVQYGRMSGTDFRVFAVYDFDLHEEGKRLTTGYYIGGMELLADEETLDLPEGYLLLPNHAVTPFLYEQAEFIKKGYTPVTNYAHFPPLIGRPRTSP